MNKFSAALMSAVLMAPNVPFSTSEMKLGQTKVEVFRRDEDGKVRSIDTGVVVQIGSSFARVYNSATPADGGDTCQRLGEFYPVKSKDCWMEFRGTLRTPIKIDAELT